MIFPHSFQATGVLAILEGSTPADLLSTRGVVADDGESKGWSKLLLTSSRPLLKELDERPDFTYHLLHRTSAEHTLLAASDLEVVNALLETSGKRDTARTPAVNVSQLVSDLVETPAEYALSAAFARVHGFGQQLRSIAFWGSDVTESDLFRNSLSSLQVYRVSLRRVATGQEALSVSNRGEVSFKFSGRNSLSKVDAALRFLKSAGVIQWGRTSPFAGLLTR